MSEMVTVRTRKLFIYLNAAISALHQ